VVNCLRGERNVMLEGTRNLIEEALRAGASRFVHLSSVAIYGDPPAPQAAVESAAPAAAKGSYGWIKLQQDQMVQRMAARGLSSIILCPPNIIGPGSYFLLDILGSLLRGDLLLADGGRSVCTTVDVRNLAHACFLGLSKGGSNGERYFVTDDEEVTWADIVDALRAAGQIAGRPTECSLEELGAMHRQPLARTPSVWASAKHLVSSDVRNALRKDPLLAKVDGALRTLVAKLGSRVEDNLRLAIEGPLKGPSDAGGKPNLRLSAQQLRGVRHRCDKAKADLGYRPPCTFAGSMSAFARWLQCTRGMRDPDWSLRKILFGYSPTA
jgi:nucleoside-diphosphate-sugar epimerase